MSPHEVDDVRDNTARRLLLDTDLDAGKVVVAFVAGDGTVAGVDTIAMHGGRFYGECRASSGSVKDGTFIYRVRHGATSTPITRVIVTPLSEDFADGTTWTNSAAPLVGTQLLQSGMGQ